ncbi:hypothetical protein KPRYC492_11250 [Klebsiella pneumoniae RYC492]|nr:hypothetical protein KPRYC492_11250 [Klebsiella pneumoniae RYC492]
MLLFNIPFLDGTMAWTYYVRHNAGFFPGISKNGKSLSTMADEG